MQTLRGASLFTLPVEMTGATIKKLLVLWYHRLCENATGSINQTIDNIVIDDQTYVQADL